MKFLEGWAKPVWLANLMKGYHDDIDTKLNAIQNMFGTAGEADVKSEDILYDKKAYNGTTLITGSMPNNGAKTATLAAGGSYTIPKGYHNGNGKVTAADLASQTAGTASEGKILSGLTAWIAGKKVTGKMANKAGTSVAASAVTQDDINTYFNVPAAGYYDTNSKVYTPNSNLIKQKRINLSVNQIVAWTTFTKSVTIDNALEVLGVGIYDTTLYPHDGVSVLAIRSFSFDGTKLTVTFYGNFTANSSNSCQIIIFYR